MTDVYSKEKRSYVMSKIRSKNTKPEILVRRYLFKQGFRFRVNVKRLPGTPDIVLRKYRSVIFVHGCFWHGHENCPIYVPPKTHSEYWFEKINRNRERDAKARAKIKAMGWNVIVIWECQLKPKVCQQTFEDLLHLLRVFLLKKYGYKESKECGECDFPVLIAAESIVAYNNVNSDKTNDF